MQKEIKIINYVFKVNKSMVLLSVENYINYNNTEIKVKLLHNDEYLENSIIDYNATENFLIFKDFKIYKDYIEVEVGSHKIKINVDNTLLLNDYQTENNKNTYTLYDTDYYNGVFDGEEVSGKIYCDYEVIKMIPDNYYKIYVIDFEEFSGMFSMTTNDIKVINVNLKYKDVEFKNKRVLYLKDVKFFKTSSIKLKASGHFYWQIKFKEKKSIKANASIIPFRYLKGSLSLVMKKKLFKDSLNALCKDALVICYKYI